MDPVEAVNVETDTGFMLAHTGQERGHDLWIYQPHQLSLEDGRVTARARGARLQAVPGDPAHLQAPEVIDLAEMDVVLMRQDPPFDMAYVDATHILEHVHPKTLVVNDPVEVRNAPEKLFVTRFRGLQPPTLISRDEEAIADFHARHRDIVVKPLNAAGGSGVLRLKEGDANLDALLELHFELSREPVVAQAFIPGVSEGDKRILLVDGEAVGAINRVPKAGQVRSNLRVGGTAQPVELTERDREICATIGPELKRRGLMFVGIDVIAGWLTEINVTAPTGAQQLKRFGGADAATLLWERIEAIRAG